MSPAIPLNPDTADRQENGERLPHLIVQTTRLELLDKDLVRLLQNSGVFLIDITNDPDRKPRTAQLRISTQFSPTLNPPSPRPKGGLAGLE